MRNHYDDAFGVLPLEWHLGAPVVDFGVVIVEIWEASVDLLREPRKPGVKVMARREVWVRVGDAWKAVGWKGELRDQSAGEVRRWARAGDVRWWHETIALEGWK